jgi:hypothetical protein
VGGKSEIPAEIGVLHLLLAQQVKERDDGDTDQKRRSERWVQQSDIRCSGPGEEQHRGSHIRSCV